MFLCCGGDNSRVSRTSKVSKRFVEYFTILKHILLLNWIWWHIDVLYTLLHPDLPTCQPYHANQLPQTTRITANKIPHTELRSGAATSIYPQLSKLSRTYSVGFFEFGWFYRNSWLFSRKSKDYLAGQVRLCSADRISVRPRPDMDACRTKGMHGNEHQYSGAQSSGCI